MSLPGSAPWCMIRVREWFEHALGGEEGRREEVFRHLDTIVANQVVRILARSQWPEVIEKEGSTTFGSMGLLGHLATYSLNLVLLRTVLSTDGFEFDEGRFGVYEGGTRAWDRLTCLWRSWFSMDSLRGLAAVWTATRDDGRIRLRAREGDRAVVSSDRLESVENVYVALADDIGAGLAGMVVQERDGGCDREALARLRLRPTSM